LEYQAFGGLCTAPSNKIKKTIIGGKKIISRAMNIKVIGFSPRVFPKTTAPMMETINKAKKIKANFS
jgi:hypothetical protein